MVVAPVAAVTPMAAMVVPVAPAVVVVAPMAAMMAPVSVMMVAMPPVPGMVAVTEMVVVPLHRLDRRLRCEGRGRSRRQRGGVGGASAEEAARHQREGGEREKGATCRGWFRHRVTSVHRAVQSGLESEARFRRMNAY